jgi:proprotein convertase subtilisin/kexin type 5
MLSYNCVANCTVYIHFVPNRTCLTSCPSNYYQITSNGLKFCQACTSPCSNCINATFCLSCVSGYFYYSYSCLTSCPQSYFADNSTRICTSCISPCKTCTSLSTCLSCSQGFWNGTLCTNSCPSGQFGDSVNFICLSCHSSCLTCITSAVTCTSCSPALIFYNRQCLNSCPSRFYNSSGVCTSCVPPCYTCASSAACLSCSYNYLLN